jgi:hypothetical protein
VVPAGIDEWVDGEAYSATFVRRAVCPSGGRGTGYISTRNGLPDAMNRSGERFGDARLLEAIGRGRGEPLGDGIADLRGEIAWWRGGERAQDDSSILAVECAAESRRQTRSDRSDDPVCRVRQGIFHYRCIHRRRRGKTGSLRCARRSRNDLRAIRPTPGRGFCLRQR